MVRAETTAAPPAKKPGDRRLTALRRFAIGITLLNLLGQTLFGFEPPWAALVAAPLAAYAAELLLETVEAWSAGRAPRYRGGVRACVDFLLPPHITGCAVAMLLYGNARLMPVVFAAVVAIASKTLLRAPLGRGRRHFLNPSNLGITVALLLFPWVGLAMPYQFTERFTGWGDVALPLVVLTVGSLFNFKLTGKLPLAAGWVGGFALQAVLRTTVLGTSTISALLPMTGVAFILFTFYMVTDPATTPVTPRAQVAFGATVAAAYGLLMAAHVVFGLFFALTAVSLGRGLLLWTTHWLRRGAPTSLPLPVAARLETGAG
jgi:hypothetical protein